MSKKAYIFIAAGFEEIEALSSVDILRRAEVDVQTISITHSNIVTGAHQQIIATNYTIDEVDLSDADILILPLFTFFLFTEILIW